MLPHEHAQTALEFLEKADRHFADGDQIQASEKLWGAAAHAVTAIAQERGCPHTSHPSLKRAAEQLSAEQNDPQIADRFGIAEKYHLDSHHLFMEAEEWTTDRPKVHDLVARVLALRGNNAAPAATASPAPPPNRPGRAFGGHHCYNELVRTEVEMLTHEHAQTALEFLEKADRHFADGDQIQASEKLWGAAAHAVMAVAQERGWPHTSHPALKRAAEQLSAEQNDPLIASNFGVSEKYHRDFYHLFMEAEEWTTDRPKISDLVARVLALRGNDAGPGRNGQPGAAN